jgi:hypothetical protein
MLAAVARDPKALWPVRVDPLEGFSPRAMRAWMSSMQGISSAMLSIV